MSKTILVLGVGTGGIITAKALSKKVGNDRQPLSNAKDAEIQLQVMLTKGESLKGNAQEGMSGNYFERNVKLRIK